MQLVDDEAAVRRHLHGHIGGLGQRERLRAGASPVSDERGEGRREERSRLRRRRRGRIAGRRSCRGDRASRCAAGAPGPKLTTGHLAIGGVLDLEELAPA